jgi:sigma-E factor negative regulatory protein RseC
MLEQSARVVEASPEGVWVEAVEPSGCGTCGGQGCSSRRIAELLQRRPRRYRVDSDLELAAGERVVVGIAEGSVLRAALRGYGVPLLLMLAGALLADALWPGDLSAVAGMLAGGLLGWTGLRGRAAPLPMVVRKESQDGIWLSKPLEGV